MRGIAWYFRFGSNLAGSIETGRFRIPIDVSKRDSRPGRSPAHDAKAT